MVEGFVQSDALLGVRLQQPRDQIFGLWSDATPSVAIKVILAFGGAQKSVLHILIREGELATQSK